MTKSPSKLCKRTAAGTYSARVSVRDRVTGRPRSRRLTTPSEQQCRTEVERLRRQGDAPGSGQPLGAYLADWLDRTAPDLRPSSVANYHYHVRHCWAGLAAVPLARLTAGAIEDHARALVAGGRSPSTVGSAVGLLRRALRDAVRRGALATNPAALARPPRRARFEACPWTAAESRAFLAGLDPDDAWSPLWVVLVCTGLRVGEAMALRWVDVDLDAAELRVERTATRAAGGGRTAGPPKSSQGRRLVPLLPAAVTALRRQRVSCLEARLGGMPSTDLVFPAAKGGMRDHAGVNRALARATARAGLRRVRPHDLRHGALTYLIGLGVDPATVAKIAGHSDVAVTLGRYTHPDAEGIRAAMARLGELLASGAEGS